MGAQVVVPITAVVELEPALDAAQVAAALSAWLDKTYGAALESAERDGLMVEYRAADGAPLSCQLVASDSDTQTRRTVTVFSDDNGSIVVVDEAPLIGTAAGHSVVDLSPPLRLLLELLTPIALATPGLLRGSVNQLEGADPDELLAALRAPLAPGLVVAVIADADGGPTRAQAELLDQIAGLALVGVAPASSILLASVGLPGPARPGSVVSLSRTGDGLDANVIPATSLRTKADSARRLLVRRHLAAPIPFGLERRRSAALTRLVGGQLDVDVPTAIQLLDEESERTNALTNRVKELETLLERSYDEQDAALSELDGAQSQVRYLQQAINALGEVPLAQPQDDEEWNPDSVVDALVAARESLAFLVIGVDEDPCSVLDGQQKRSIWAKKIWSSLRALNDYCKAKAEGRFSGDITMYRSDTPAGAIPLLAEYAASESKSTGDDAALVAVRTFTVPAAVAPSGRAYMDQHVKIDKGGHSAPRIHLLDDSGGTTQRVYVGYVGPHLPTSGGF